MALKINGTALKKCNVNNIACKHINVNGVNVWNAEYVFFPNETTANLNNWTVKGGTFTVSDAEMVIYSASAGSSAQCSLEVDFTPYKTCYIVCTASTYPENSCRLQWRRTSDNVIQGEVQLDEAGVYTIDVSAINTTCKFGYSGEHGAGGTITRIYFEE